MHVVRRLFRSGRAIRKTAGRDTPYAIRYPRDRYLQDERNLNQLNAAVLPATKAGLQVEYGAGAGQIGSSLNDVKSEAIGLALALVLLLLMFGSLMAAAIPLVSVIFSVLSGLALLGLLARGHVPDDRAHDRHAARPRRRRRLQAVPDGQAP
jgi:hypothetical protein